MLADERERIIEAILAHPWGIYGCEVCQLCGQLGTFSGYASAVGGHHGGEFVSLSHGHVVPAAKGVYGSAEFARLRSLLSEGERRFCEICRRALLRSDACAARGGKWLCATCAAVPDRDEDLSRLSRRRYMAAMSDAELIRRLLSKTAGLPDNHAL